MKKIISIVLCLVLIFSFSVCSFGATPVNLEATISHDLAMVLSIVDAYLPALQEIETDVNDISGNLLMLGEHLQTVNTITGLWQTRIETLLTNFDTYFREDFITALDSNFGGVISSVSSVRSAVSAFESHLLDDIQYNFADYQTSGTFGHLVFMLQQVLADEDDLAFKQKNKNNEKAVIEFAETGTANGNISYLSSISSAIDSFGFLSDMISIEYGLAETFEAIQYNLTSDEPWIWFTESNKNDINGTASSTFSARGDSYLNEDVEIVTDYLGENKSKLSQFLQERGH